ncbi:hypothetical protein M885DRAFT_617215 [Pelagophyceae sp. CCMP2097]|nr:hypothetical protein M885DRAFT_617215 [Pelagophyceae sp. CCMP2097]
MLERRETSAQRALACFGVAAAVVFLGGAASLYGLSRPVARPPRVALLTTASKRATTAGESEYGELKAAYVYAASVDNKARYAAARGWTLVVGGDVAESASRSARWIKVAWLRRLVAQDFDWIIWMDLDCFFAAPGKDVLSELDLKFDAHFVPDAVPLGAAARVNTGFFALKATPWTRQLLEAVWAHNDFGEGMSDQQSFNHVLNDLPKAEAAAHVQTYSKPLLNAFPAVRGVYVPTEDYELPLSDGDESTETLIAHYAGQFGGARSLDGVTPPTMLVQFLDLMLLRHERFLADVDALVAATPDEGATPGPAAPAPRASAVPGLRSTAEAAAVMRAARAPLAACLALIRGSYVRGWSEQGIKVYGPPAGGPACEADAALADARDALQGLLAPGGNRATSLLCHAPQADTLKGVAAVSAADMLGRVADPRRAFRHKKLRWSGGGAAVVAHECSYYDGCGGGVVDGDSRVGVGDVRGGVGVAAAAADCGASLAVRAAAAKRFRAAVVVVAPPAATEAAWWLGAAGRALDCLDHAPPGAKLVVAAGDEARWAALGLGTRAAAVGARDVVYADELYTCHAFAATTSLGRVRDAVNAAVPPPRSAEVSVNVALACGRAGGGFRDCAKFRAALAAAGVSTGVIYEATLADHAGADAAVIIAPRGSELAALVALRARAGATVIEVGRQGASKAHLRSESPEDAVDLAAICAALGHRHAAVAAGPGGGDLAAAVKNGVAARNRNDLIQAVS